MAVSKTFIAVGWIHETDVPQDKIYQDRDDPLNAFRAEPLDDTMLRRLIPIHP